MFHVRWEDTALQELADVWHGADSELRARITAAANRIDQELRLGQREDRRGTGGIHADRLALIANDFNLSIHTSAAREGANTAAARPGDVNDTAKKFLVLQLPSALGHRLFEARRGLGQQRGLKRADLTEVNALAQARELVSGAVGKTFRLEPDSSKGMPFSEHHQRVKSRLFKTRGHEQDQVKAGAHFVGE